MKAMTLTQMATIERPTAAPLSRARETPELRSVDSIRDSLLASVKQRQETS